jgi:hypothetical protein
MPAPLLAAAAPLAALGLRADALALPVAIVAALGVFALVLGKRKAARPRLVRIVETASLGPKRSLIVARVGDETLILGASEAGIALLGTRTDLAPAGVPGGGPGAAALAPGPGASRPAPAHGLAPSPDAAAPGILGRILSRKRPAAPVFEHALRESLEDQELRAKLAAGRRGTVA